MPDDVNLEQTWMILHILIWDGDERQKTKNDETEGERWRVICVKWEPKDGP